MSKLIKQRRESMFQEDLSKFNTKKGKDKTKK